LSATNGMCLQKSVWLSMLVTPSRTVTLVNTNEVFIPLLTHYRLRMCWVPYDGG
jgi:hypothetical protein